MSVASASASTSALATSHDAGCSSDYLLITNTSNTSYEQTETDTLLLMPRPPAFHLVPCVAAIDVVVAIVFTILAHVHHVSLGVFLLAWNYVRATVVLYTGLSPRIRERAFVLALTLIITLLFVLYDSNALVQRLPLPSNNLAFSSRPSRLDDNPSILLPIYLLVHLGLALSEWIVYVVCVGVSKRRNPYGLGITSFGTNRVLFSTDLDTHLEPPPTSPTGSPMSSDDEYDQDDIVDIPPVISPDSPIASLRSRTSRATLGEPSHARRLYDTF